MIAWLSAVALGADGPQCSLDALQDPPESLSVAWVSPVGKRARNAAWLYVVPTRELRAFSEGEGKGDPARTLQWLGLRKSAKPPHRTYKVVIFDTAPGELCRPVVSAESAIAGVAPCDSDHAGPRHLRAFGPRNGDGGCGTTTDQRTGKAGAVVYRAQWQSLATDGFCLLPLERFLAPE
jgi:hypothetical protein